MALNCTGALVTLAAQEFDGLVEFYCKLLGREPGVLLPDRYAEFELPGVRLGIFRPKERGGEGEEGLQNSKFPSVRLRLPRASADGENKIQNSPEGMGLCLEVGDLERAIAHLTHLGCPPPGKIMTASHGHEIYAYDPEGNWLILHQGRCGS